jgi:hypothetical protein
VNDLKIHFNINLNNWDHSVYTTTHSESKIEQKNSFKMLAHFFTHYEMRSFSLNFQLVLKDFDIGIAQQLKPRSLQRLTIGFSEIAMHNLLALTQIEGIKKLIVHDTIVTYNAF